MSPKLMKNKVQKRVLGTMDSLYVSANHVMFNAYWDKYGNPFDEETFESVIFLADCSKPPSQFTPQQPKRWGLDIEALFHNEEIFELLEMDWTDESVFSR